MLSEKQGIHIIIFIKEKNRHKKDFLHRIKTKSQILYLVEIQNTSL